MQDFIYRTPLIRFSNQLIPLLANAAEINIAKLNSEAGENQTLAEHLSNFFQILFEEDLLASQTIQLTANWTYALQPGANDLPGIDLPVLLYPPFEFMIPADYTIPDGGCPTEITATTPFVCQAAQSLRSWFQHLNPVMTEAKFGFELSIYSLLSDTHQPILILRNIILPAANVTDL